MKFNKVKLSPEMRRLSASIDYMEHILTAGIQAAKSGNKVLGSRIYVNMEEYLDELDKAVLCEVPEGYSRIYNMV